MNTYLVHAEQSPKKGLPEGQTLPPATLCSAAISDAAPDNTRPTDMAEAAEAERPTKRQRLTAERLRSRADQEETIKALESALQRLNDAYDSESNPSERGTIQALIGEINELVTLKLTKLPAEKARRAELVKLGKDIGKQVWRLVLASEPEHPHYGRVLGGADPIPLDLAKLDELLRRCPADALPLETTKEDVFGPDRMGNCRYRLPRCGCNLQELRFSSGAAGRSPAYVVERDMHEKISDEDISRSVEKIGVELTRGMTLVEWLCRTSTNLDSMDNNDYLDWVTATLRALIDRGAMVTECALSIAEKFYYEVRNGHCNSDAFHKAKLMVYMLAKCPSILTRTPQLNRRHAKSYGGTKPMLDYYAERANGEGDGLCEGDRVIADQVLCGLVYSPDVHDALRGEYRWNMYPGDREGPWRRLVALEKSGLEKSGDDKRPPPIIPEAGVTHVEGGPFSRWHARHERWVAEVVGRLVDGEDPSEFRHPYNNADRLTYAFEWELSR